MKFFYAMITGVQAIEACGATLLYLPPYSPDLNPIENAFAKLKAHVRKAAARTIEALETAAAYALQTFRPEHCENFFAHAGYGRDKREAALEIGRFQESAENPHRALCTSFDTYSGRASFQSADCTT